MKMYIKKTIGGLILSNLFPLLIWFFWDDSYNPKNSVDVFFNSFHPLVCGWIVQLIAVSFLGLAVIGIYLINPKAFK